MIKSIQIREEEYMELLMQYAAAAGFKEISLSFGSTDLFFKDGYEAAIDRIGGLLDKYKLNCVQTHLPCYHLLVSSEIEEDATENAIKRCILYSAKLGAKWTAFHPRTDLTSGFNRSKSYDANKAALSRYLECSEKSGTGIAIENMPLYPYTNPEWRFFGGGYEEICELCDSFKSDKMGICWDFGHAHTAALNQAEALRYIGKRLKITHVHDNYKNSDHHQLPLLGSTECRCIDWNELMPVMKEIDYQGPLTLEIIFPPEPMLQSYVKLCYDSVAYLDKLSENQKI